MDRGDDDAGELVEVEVPIEVLEDTNFEPKPEPPPKGADDAPRRRDIPGRSDLQRQIDRLTRTSQDNEKRALTAEEQLAATRRRASEEVGKARQETAQTRMEAVETARVSLDTAIQENDAALTAAKKEMSQAFSSGDGDAVAEAQARISALTVARHENMRRRDTLPSKEQVAAEAEQTTKPKDPSKMTTEERFEAYLTQFAPRSQEWLRKHPEFASDARLNRKLGRAHEDAVDAGHEQNSDDYFDFINEKLGFKEVSDDDYFEEDGDPPPRREQRQERREPRERDVQNRRGSIEQNGSDRGARQFTDQRNNRPMRSAPVRGGGGGGSGDGRRVSVALTAGEREAATDGTLPWNHDGPVDPTTGNPRYRKGDPIGLTEMARRKMLMKKNGRYNIPEAQ